MFEMCKKGDYKTNNFLYNLVNFLPWKRYRAKFNPKKWRDNVIYATLDIPVRTVR